MNAIREIKKVKNGKVEIELPNILNGKEVEVIVLTNSDYSQKKVSQSEDNRNVRSLAGIFHKYANPDLITKEKDGWSIAVKDKHGLH